jgi:hypothetical protein
MNTASTKGKAIVEHAKSRTEEVRRKVSEAMRAIELDIEQNEGIYPFNGGRLTQAEVCRRAGIRNVTLGGKAHKDTTREMVRVWLDGIEKNLVAGKRAVRKAVTQRADDWHARYLAAARMSDLYHIQFVDLNDKLKKSGVRISELEAENVQLRSELSHGKVVRMPKPKRGR